MPRNRTDERGLVRELAAKVAETAASPRNLAVLKRWRDVNSRRKPDRAPVWCRPVGAWKELIPDSSLACRDPWLRGVEYEFRQALCKHDIGDDTPAYPFFDVPAVFDVEPVNTWGVDIRRREAGDGGAWGFDPPLRTPADFDLLRIPRFAFNAAETMRRLDRAHELLGDILTVRQVAEPPLHATMGAYAAELRGLETMMLDMIDNPELLHRLMAFLRDSVTAAMDMVERDGVLTPNNNGPMTESDPVGTRHATGKTGCDNLWCMANSQEFDQVSPAMWEEFCLEYQKPVMTRFGAVAYGCCENLTRKIEGVLSVPNLRVFVCSAWTDLNAVVDKVGAKHTIMWRQKASDVVMPRDVTAIRRHLDDGASRLRGCRYQIVLRELQTLGGNPDRLHVWTRLAVEAAGRHAE